MQLTRSALLFFGGVAIGAGMVWLFLVTGSPLGPKGSETITAVTVAPPLQAEFRNGQVETIAGDTVTVVETSGGSFAFTLTDDVVIRGLNADDTFELVDRSRLTKGDFVTVFYQINENAQRVNRVDIVRES